jgi:sugar phosphate isomerase/epimerase
MRVGIDSYSYHRLYGEIRSGEVAAPGAVWPVGPTPVLDHARSLEVDDIYLETCYLPQPEAIDVTILAAAGPVRVGFSWGHPWPAGAFHGLDGGRSPGAEDGLARWIAAAARLGHEVMRITLGSPASRGTEPAADLIARLVEPTRRAAERAAAVGLKLAIENHGDLRAQDVMEVIERAGAPVNLGVTLDNVNLIRVGDDMLEGTRLLAPRTFLVQLKDHPPTPDASVWGGPLSVALGEGVAPLRELLAILEGAGFDGPVCVELASLGGEQVDELAMIERSVAWLRANVPGATHPT